jgi:hypothetical protein
VWAGPDASGATRRTCNFHGEVSVDQRIPPCYRQAQHRRVNLWKVCNIPIYVIPGSPMDRHRRHSGAGILDCRRTRARLVGWPLARLVHRSPRAQRQPRHVRLPRPAPQEQREDCRPKRRRALPILHPGLPGLDHRHRGSSCWRRATWYRIDGTPGHDHQGSADPLVGNAVKEPRQGDKHPMSLPQ